MNPRRSFLLATLCAVMAAALAPPAQAQGGALEQSVKAAFLPKFAGYVEWPPASMPAPGQPFTLCIIGSDPFGPRIDQAAARQRVDGHGVTVRRMRTADDAVGCQIAFVSSAAALAALDRSAVLTITDERLGSTRGIIHFELRDGRVRFHIDDAQAARSGLSISSRLLALGLSVRPRGRS